MALSSTASSVQRERLTQLLKEEGNSECADCKEPDPTWASTNHGTFICTQCAGVHRLAQIGVHFCMIGLSPRTRRCNCLQRGIVYYTSPYLSSVKTE